MTTLLEKVKANLILEHDKDDVLLQQFITAAVDYAESFQHVESGSYSDFAKMSPTTE